MCYLYMFSLFDVNEILKGILHSYKKHPIEFTYLIIKVLDQALF